MLESHSFWVIKALVASLLFSMHTPTSYSTVMARLITYSLFAFALSTLTIASPLVLPRQGFGGPTNVALGTVIAGCGMFRTVEPGNTCLFLEQEFNITDASFRALNPEVNSACTNLIAGEAYCIQAATDTSAPPPSNVAPGTITTGCAQFFTVLSGVTCDEIDTMFEITLPVFLSLNPEINSECTNLIAGEAYCVQST